MMKFLILFFNFQRIILILNQGQGTVCSSWGGPATRSTAGKWATHVKLCLESCYSTSAHCCRKTIPSCQAQYSQLPVGTQKYCCWTRGTCAACCAEPMCLVASRVGCKTCMEARKAEHKGSRVPLGKAEGGILPKRPWLEGLLAVLENIRGYVEGASAVRSWSWSWKTIFYFRYWFLPFLSFFFLF